MLLTELQVQLLALGFDSPPLFIESSTAFELKSKQLVGFSTFLRHVNVHMALLKLFERNLASNSSTGQALPMIQMKRTHGDFLSQVCKFQIVLFHFVQKFG